MKITLLAIGKKHDSKLTPAIAEYTDRLKHYTRLEWNLLEAKISPSMDTDEIRSSESELLLSRIPETDIVFLLDETGTELSTPELANKLQTLLNQSVKDLTIIIGGAYGVNEKLMKRADFVWGLSPLVFPHQLVRLILVEQLYRAHTILAGEKYHHT